MTRRRKAALIALSTVGVAAGLSIAVRTRGERFRLSALQAAHAIGAEPAEDLLRYAPYCYSPADFWLLMSEGPDALWAKHWDKDSRFFRAFSAQDRNRLLPILRKTSLGPMPSDAEIVELATALKSLAGERRELLDRRIWAFSAYSQTSPEQRLQAETALHPLSVSRNANDRLWYARLMQGSDAPESRTFFRNSLDDPDPRVVAAAIRRSGRGSRQLLRDRIVALLDAPNREIRLAAWDAVWRFVKNSPEVRARVKRGLFDADREIRLRATRASSAIAEDPNLDVRKVALLNDPDAEIRVAALYFLDEKLGKKRLAEIRRLLNDSTLVVRTSALDRLAREKDAECLPTARAWLRSTETEEKRSALYAVRRLDDRASLGAVKNLQSDPDVGGLAQALANKWEPSSLQKLQKLFQIPFVQ